MAVTLTVDETRSAAADGQWQITWEVTAATDIPEEIFAYNSQDETFARVCRIIDLGLPTTRQPIAYPYWRTNTLTLIYSTVIDATSAVTEIQAAIQSLIDAQIEASSFVGTDTITFEAT